MSIKPLDYEELLAEYSSHRSIVALLKQYRPYLELVPSMRRPARSIITIPFPIARVRTPSPTRPTQEFNVVNEQLVRVPCDIAVLMCDPDWKVKTGIEVFIFIHRPGEDFSQLLSRWRQTQVVLGKPYEWLMPRRYQHILNDGSEQSYPLFVVLPETPERIKKGLRGAALPVVVHQPLLPETGETVEQPTVPTNHDHHELIVNDLESLEQLDWEEELFTDGSGG